MGRFWDEFKHAFSVAPDEADCAELPESLERLAREIVDRGLETPAVIALDAARPLNLLASQTMIAAWPIAQLLGEGARWHEIATALENRSTLDRLVKRIEQLSR